MGRHGRWNNLRLAEFVVLPRILIGLLVRLHAWLRILLRRLIGKDRSTNGVRGNCGTSSNNKLLSGSVNLFLMMEVLMIDLI